MCQFSVSLDGMEWGGGGGEEQKRKKKRREKDDVFTPVL